MCVITKFGKPDLFITFTCNPQWNEIERNLKSYKTFSDCPDLVSRVFHEPLCLRKVVFGKVKGYTYVVERQKVLLILGNDNEIRASNDIDRIVSAGIQVIQTELDFFKIIKHSMIHGCCGVIKSNLSMHVK